MDSPEWIKEWCCVSINVLATSHPFPAAGPSLDGWHLAG
jgi:hypothetical protein